MKKNFSYKAEIQSISSIRRDFESLIETWAIPKSELKQILLIVEELFSNIIRYAYEDDDQHFIDISISRDENNIRLVIMDDGIPFNPLEYKHSQLTDPASTDDGGMGLSLIKAFADSIEYIREEPRNCLNIQKIVHNQPESEN